MHSATNSAKGVRTDLLMESMNFFQYFVNKSVLTHSSAIKLGINMYQEVILMYSEILN